MQEDEAEHPVNAARGAVLTFVPLKRMCSRKWAVPLFSSVSKRLPELIQMPTVVVSAKGIASVATRMPFERVVICEGDVGRVSEARRSWLT